VAGVVVEAQTLKDQKTKRKYTPRRIQTRVSGKPIEEGGDEVNATTHTDLISQIATMSKSSTIGTRRDAIICGTTPLFSMQIAKAQSRP
jgi:hypothetical protein